MKQWRNLKQLNELLVHLAFSVVFAKKYVFDTASKAHYETSEQINHTLDDYEGYTDQWNEFLAGMNKSDVEEDELTPPTNYHPELVWKPRKGDTRSLEDISEQFQRLLNEQSRSSSTTLECRQACSRLRTPHRLLTLMKYVQFAKKSFKKRKSSNAHVVNLHRRCALPHLNKKTGAPDFSCRACKLDPCVAPELMRHEFQQMLGKEYLKENVLFK
ncbi:hypothetical protein CPB84DRAFT_1749399 [Gymnopilus junonius]|uniref:Uncharacterized protein n=1 Tax=Gymnopilus junonius TaxID=109634 RepID=A0A9P5NG40_GYMJU|nr:hypothetical protein CPB84DRAFT_1749399 [Gymnopilus junonius]